MENNIRFDFIKSRKIWMAIYALIIVAGIVVFALFGANLSIDFKGGATFEYSFTGDIDLEKAEQIVEDALNKKVNVTESTGYTTNAKTLVVSLATDESVSVEAQENLETKLNETFKDNKIELSSSNSVSPSIASNFFLKCLVAVVLASLLVNLYVGIRFRKIGGISAGIFALLALLLDCIMAFCFCIFSYRFSSTYAIVIRIICNLSTEVRKSIFNAFNSDLNYFHIKPPIREIVPIIAVKKNANRISKIILFVFVSKFSFLVNRINNNVAIVPIQPIKDHITYLIEGRTFPTLTYSLLC